MQPEDSPDELERDLAARLAAYDGERAADGSAGSGGATAGLPPEAEARLQSALEGLVRLQARWPGQPQPDDSPRPFGKFLIERELGRGGHGIVFLALDPALNRRVALKIPRPELLDNPDWRRRFLREARALARLDHPGIVDVLEVGEVDGVCYIATAYCDGPNLTDWLKGRGAPLRPRDAARLARDIAEAIGHAHARGVVHRDIKPRNILMPAAGRPDDPEELGARPRVTDFGLAKLLDADAELTRTGAVLGTPRYMAPEQREARRDLVGPPTDVYAIGAILDEMLVGRRDAGESRSDGGSHARPVARALRAIVGKCLEPDPARRYADATELAVDLHRFMSGGRVHAGRFSPRAIMARAGRRPGLVMTTLAMASLLAAVFVLGRRPSRGLAFPKAIAPAPSPARPPGDQMERGKRYVADLQLIVGLLPRDLGGSTYKLSMARDLLDRHRPRDGRSDLRTWEWYYFARMLYGERTTLAGHRGAVYHLEYSRDGTRLASSGEDGARVWNAATGAPEATIREHTGFVNWVGFSPDGTKLATTSDDKTVGIWNAADGRRVLPPLIHQHKTVVVLFAPDGRRLIACDRGGIVTTWDASTGAAIGSPHKVSDMPLEGMDLSPDGSIVAVATSGEVALWDYPEFRRRLPPIPADKGSRFDCVAFSHDGRRFATAGGSIADVRVWETRTGRLSHSFSHHPEERVFTVAFSPDDRLLLSTASDEAARIWDLAAGRCVGVLAGHGAWVWCGGFSPDGRAAATGDGDGSIKLWSIPHRGAETRFDRISSPCLAMACSSDGRSIYTPIASGYLVAWDSTTGALRRELLFRPKKPSIDAAFAPGATLVATADAEGTLTVGEPLEKPTVTIPRATAARPCLSFSADGKVLAYVAADGAVALLHATEPAPRPSALGSLPSAPTALAFAPDGSLLAGTIDGRLVALAGRSGAAREAPERGHQGRITCLSVSPDETVCATGGEDAAIVLWERDSLRVRARLQGHQQPIDALAFTPDGKTLISAADCVQLWNVATSQPTFSLIGGLDRSDHLARLAISADGTAIAAMVKQDGGYHGFVWRAARPGAEQETIATSGP